ncbi:MAG: hypothetical protein MUE46_13670 [Xanthomonadales bacterium]|nr:hypothetical protein [Xanthomonadales bacterium]
MDEQKEIDMQKRQDNLAGHRCSAPISNRTFCEIVYRPIWPFPKRFANLQSHAPAGFAALASYAEPNRVISTVSGHADASTGVLASGVVVRDQRSRADGVRWVGLAFSEPGP